MIYKSGISNPVMIRAITDVPCPDETSASLQPDPVIAKLRRALSFLLVTLWGAFRVGKRARRRGSVALLQLHAR